MNRETVTKSIKEYLRKCSWNRASVDDLKKYTGLTAIQIRSFVSDDRELEFRYAGSQVKYIKENYV